MSAPLVRPVRERWLTRANALTLARLAAAPLLAAAILGGAHGTALLLFGLAVATDLLDGVVARRFGEVSRLGGLLDHATDAAFVSIGLGAVAHLGEAPALLPWLIAAAFAQYALDSRAAAGRPLRSSGLGRWNGIAYFVLLGIPVVRDALALGWPGAAALRALGWALVISTVLSMVERGIAFLRARASRISPAPEREAARRRARGSRAAGIAGRSPR